MEEQSFNGSPRLSFYEHTRTGGPALPMRVCFLLEVSMKRALIIIAIILLIAAVVGVVFLGGLMMNNYAKTGSVFGSGFDSPDSFWEEVIGDEILNEVRPDEPTEQKHTSAPPITHGNYIFEGEDCTC